MNFFQGYLKVLDAFKTFEGSGLLVTIALVCVMWIGFFSHNDDMKKLLTKYSAFVLIIFFCPIWGVYAMFKSDYEIIYRILWLFPIALLISYVFTEIITKFSDLKRTLIFVFAVLLIIISGEYVYKSPYFSKAENEYHVPETVVKICDEIIVPGREIQAAFPDELMVYVRQYTPYVCMPYGRDTLFEYATDRDELKASLAADIIDTEYALGLLRATGTPYLIVNENKRFTDSLSDYGFVYVTSVDGYDIYLDNSAYLGLDFVDFG